MIEPICGECGNNSPTVINDGTLKVLTKYWKADPDNLLKIIEYYCGADYSIIKHERKRLDRHIR